MVKYAYLVATMNMQFGVAEVCINGLWADICSIGSTSTPTTIARAFCQQHTGQQSGKQINSIPAF